MKVRKVGIFTQLFILLAVLLLLGNGILGVFIYNKSKDTLFDQIQINAQNIASCAAMNVDGALLDKVEIGGEQSAEYKAVLE